MSYQRFDITGIGSLHDITMEKSGTITLGTDEGKAASFVSDGKVKVGVADDPLHGKIIAIHDTVITVRDNGWESFTYTGAAPVPGWNKLECDGNGGVRVDAANGVDFKVAQVDTTATTCLVKLR